MPVIISQKTLPAFLFAALFLVLINCPAAAATYDASGVWHFSQTVDWTDCPGGMESETGTLIIAQNRNSYTLYNPSLDQTYTGTVKGTTYTGSGSFSEDGETASVNFTINLTSAVSASGKVNLSFTDGSQTCGAQFDFQMTKSTGDNSLLKGNYIAVAQDTHGESSRALLTFNGNGAGTYQHLQRSQGRLQNGTLTYSMSQDGTFILTPTGGMSGQGILSADGNVMAFSYIENGFAQVGTGIKKSSGMSDAKFNGEYIIAILGSDGIGVRAQLISNGNGRGTYAVLQDAEGDFNNGNFTYDINNDGSFSITFDKDASGNGIFSSDGKIANLLVIEDDYSSIGMMIKESSGKSIASLNGENIVVGLSSKGEGYRMLIDFSGKGNADGQILDSSTNDSGNITLTYSVNSDATFSIMPQGNDRTGLGILSEDNQVAAVAFIDDYSELGFMIKKTTCIIPSPPTGVTASDDDFIDKVQVTWAAAAGAVSYDIFRANMPAYVGPVVKITRIGSANRTTYNDNTAVSGSRYYYWIKAKNACGTSKYSTFDSGYYGTPGTPPAKPDNVDATDATYTNKVVLDWTLVSGALIYEIYRADIPAFLGGKPTRIGSTTMRPYDDTTGMTGSRYYYWVKARNSWGASRYSLFDTGYAGASQSPPSAPTGISATDGLSSKVTISWAASNDTIIYEVWRATETVAEGGKPMRIGTTASNTLSLDDTTLTCGMTYYYWVKARDSWGSSAYSQYDTGYCGMAP